MITFLVRHGDAGDKRRWDGPDAGRPLSPAGLDQAEGLVLRLEDYPVERILCSPTVRCQQTVQPLARDRLLEIEPAAALGVDAHSTEILELFWDRRLANAVLCTHGETIGQLFAQLAGQGLVAPSRCPGRRVRPGCCTAPTGGRFIPATCPRWHWTADCTPADR
jgi:broad specificity phosphatase PhoE